MNSNNRQSVLILIGLMSVIVLIGFYFLIASPWLENRTKIVNLKKQIADLDDRGQTVGLKAAKLTDLKDRSLPSNVSLGRMEYDLFLNELLRAANIKNASVTPFGTENKDRERIPTLPNPETLVTTLTSAPDTAGPQGTVISNKEKPAYQKLTVKITMQKVDLKMLTEFLRGYHDTTLLHHISKMEIKRKDEASSSTSAASRSRDRSNPGEWKDLEVSIETEALVLDGVEDRKLLMSPPKNPMAAVMGNALQQATLQKPEMGRFFAVAQAAARAPKADALAAVDNNRFYASMVAKDVFHGPLPPEPKERGPIVVPPPPPPPPIDQYIKLNEITRRGDGSVSFQLRDIFNNFTYHGEIVPKGETGILEVNKNSIGPSGKAIKEYSFQKELKISDEGKSSSTYVYQIVAVDSIEGLILMGPPTKSDEKGPGMAGTSGSGNGGGRPSGNRPGSRPGSGFGPPKLASPTPPMGALGGWGLTLAAPSDVFYYLRFGQSLKDMKRLTANDIRDIVKRNMADGINPFLNPNVTLPSNGDNVATDLTE